MKGCEMREREEPDRRPNWDKWTLIPQAELWQLVALSMDIDPAKVQFDPEGHGAAGDSPCYDESEAFLDRIEIARSNTDSFEATIASGSGVDHSQFTVESFVRWILATRLSVPAEFASLLPVVGPTPVTEYMCGRALVDLRRWAQGKSSEYRRQERGEIADAYQLMVAQIDALCASSPLVTQELDALASDAALRQPDARIRESTPKRMESDVGKTVIATKHEVLTGLVLGANGIPDASTNKLRNRLDRQLRDVTRYKLQDCVASPGGGGGSPQQRLYVGLFAVWLADRHDISRNTISSRLKKRWPELSDFADDYISEKTEQQSDSTL